MLKEESLEPMKDVNAHNCRLGKKSNKGEAYLGCFS